jgi:hypothetical protein
MSAVVCEVTPGFADFERSVSVKDLGGHRQHLRVNSDFLTLKNGLYYLPIGIVYRSPEKVLIELPHESDSGAYRLWVSPRDLLEPVTAP